MSDEAQPSTIGTSITRRWLLGSAISAMLLTHGANAEEESIWDELARRDRAKNANTDQNSSIAQGLIDTSEPILSRDTAANLERAIQNYEQFVASTGSWEPPTRAMFRLKLGKASGAVSTLKRRLMANGDMPLEKRVDREFDANLDAGVRVFQARHGLTINGEVDEATFAALSVPADYRLNQLRLNAMRVQQLAPVLTDRYVLVNIPAASIEAIENGQVAQRHTAVVGRADRATPILSSKIHQVKFNPFWTVPKSIIQKDLIRYMNDDPNYLTNFSIRILDGRGNELSPSEIDWSTDDAVQYTFRQDPGPNNSLGRCKIDFYNKHAVYLHDTPDKGLFGENLRFYSSGCVRVEEVDSLIAWLLRDNGDWDLNAVRQAFDSGIQEDVSLRVQVPIHTTYVTAWANHQGTVSFRDDIYGFDAQGAVTFDT